MGVAKGHGASAEVAPKGAGSRRERVEDFEIELPPLDDGEELEKDEDGASTEHELELLDIPDDEGRGHDDAPAEDLVTGVEVEPLEPAREEEEGGGDDPLDVGEDELDLAGTAESFLDGGDEADLEHGGEDEDPGGDESAGGDSGEEGTDEPPEGDLGDGELPCLDADEDGELGDGAAADSELPDVAMGPPPWDEVGWSRVALPANAGPMRALAVSPRRVVAAGLGLLALDEGVSAGFHRSSPAARAAGLAAIALHPLDPHQLFAAADDGTLLRSRDAGGTFASSPARAPAARGGDGDVALACTAGGDGAPILWLLAGGELLRSDDLGESLLPVPLPGRARALAAADDGGLAVLSEDVAGPRLSLRRGGGWEVQELRDAARAVARGRAPSLALDGERVALGDPERGVVLSSDGGVSFSPLAGCGGARAIALGHVPEGPALFAALYLEMEDALLVALAAPSPRVVARVAREDVLDVADDPEEPVAEAVAMTWDPARETLWLAGRFGVLAFARSPRH